MALFLENLIQTNLDAAAAPLKPKLASRFESIGVERNDSAGLADEFQALDPGAIPGRIANDREFDAATPPRESKDEQPSTWLLERLDSLDQQLAGLNGAVDRRRQTPLAAERPSHVAPTLEPRPVHIHHTHHTSVRTENVVEGETLDSMSRFASKPAGNPVDKTATNSRSQKVHNGLTDSRPEHPVPAKDFEQRVPRKSPSNRPQTVARLAPKKTANNVSRVKPERGPAPHTAPRIVVEKQASASPAAPTITVTIGRLEVRGPASSPAPTKAASPPPASAVMTLDAYLRQREGALA